MPLTIGDVQLHMGPCELQGPDDLGQAIVGFIAGARKSLDIAVQELDSWEIAKAIMTARQRGVAVRLVMELDYLREGKPLAEPLMPGGGLEPNREIHNAILRTAIPVHSDFNTDIFHQKFIVRDGTALLTGSANFTDTDTSTNLNHVVIVNNAKVAKTYSREFAEIQQGHFGPLNEGHDPVPREITVSGLPMKILFAPDHNPEMEIMKQMSKAKKRVDFAIYTFSQSSGIDDAMIMLKRAGIPVRGVFDAQSANRDWAASRPVKNAGVELYVVRKIKGLSKLHHKLMVIDDQEIIVGSFNYTGPATKLNDENIIVIGDLESKDQASIKVQKKLAKYALDEIDRIISVYGRRI